MPMRGQVVSPPRRRRSPYPSSHLTPFHTKWPDRHSHPPPPFFGRWRVGAYGGRRHHDAGARLGGLRSAAGLRARAAQRAPGARLSQRRRRHRRRAAQGVLLRSEGGLEHHPSLHTLPFAPSPHTPSPLTPSPFTPPPFPGCSRPLKRCSGRADGEKHGWRGGGDTGALPPALWQQRLHGAFGAVIVLPPTSS